METAKVMAQLIPLIRIFWIDITDVFFECIIDLIVSTPLYSFKKIFTIAEDYTGVRLVLNVFLDKHWIKGWVLTFLFGVGRGSYIARELSPVLKSTQLSDIA
jgi:hypothetical protein